MYPTSNTSGCPFAANTLTSTEDTRPTGGCPFGTNTYTPARPATTRTGIPPLYYSDYLGVHTLTGLQQLRTEEFSNQPAHDEMLFIVIHQSYELWFRQILWEVDSVRGLLGAAPTVPLQSLSTACDRLARVVEIWKILVDQVRVLETMHPVSFLEFRDYLSPASGFQSMQFRLLEIRLGLRNEERLLYQQANYLSKFDDRDRAILEKAETESDTSILSLLERWLEQLSIVKPCGHSLWNSYQDSLVNMIASDRAAIESDVSLSEEDRQKQLKELTQTLENFTTIFDEEKHKDLVSRGLRRLSLKAMQNALLIQLYKDLPAFHLPHRLLGLLVDIDEYITTWRFRHTTMVHRMIGTKVGTGGSSGYHYLRSTTSDRYKVFVDIFNLSTFLVPRNILPDLPAHVADRLDLSPTPSSHLHPTNGHH